MSKDLELRLRLTATDQNVAGTVRNTKKEVQGLTSTLGTTSTASRKTASGMSAITTAGDEATRMFKLQKGSLQQVGYQFQDLAVQVGSGTSAFVAIGQQGSQLLGVLGPGGALLGAVVAISSIFGGVLFNALDDTADKADALEKALENLESIITRTQGGALILADEIRELAEASQTAAKLQIAQGVLEAESAINASVSRTKQILEGSLGNFTIDFSEALAQIDSLEAKGKSLTNLLDVSDRVGTPGSILGISFVQDELEELQDQFGVVREDGIRFFEALARAQRDPSTSNLDDLQEVVADIGLSLRETSPEFVTLANAIAKQARETGKAVQSKVELEKALKNVNEALERSGELNDDNARSQENLIANTEKQIEFLERQTALIQTGVAVREASLQTERENLRQDLEAAGFAEDRISQLFRLQDAVRSASEAEKEAAEARSEALRKEEQAQREALAAQREFETSVESLVNKLDPLGAAFESTYQSQELLIRAAQEGLITEGQRDNLIKNLVEGMAEGGEKAAEAFTNPFEDAAARVSQAVQNAIASGEWDTIGDAIGNTLASSISSIIDTSITRSLSRDLTANSGIGQQLAAAFAGPMLGAVAGGAVQLAINELDDYFSDDWDPTADRQASQGTGTVLGDINAKSESIRRAVEGSESGIGQLVGINQGMLYALQNLQSGISGASDRIARGRGGISIGSPGVMSGGDLFADATGGLLPIFDETLGLAFDFWDEATNILTLGLVDLGDLLGGKSKKRDEGIQIIGGYISDLIDETIVNAYATFRVKKHAFDDYDTKERFQRIGGDVERQFSAVFEGLFDTVLEAGLAIGYSEQSVLDALNQGRIGTARISLEGLSASQQQKELEAYFSSVFDDMAGGLFPFLEEFQQAGEGLGETLVRVANMVQITEEAVNRLGLQFSDLAGRDLVAASERLIEASGGIEQFINSMQGFIENFATDARQFELAQSDLTRSLERAGLELPNTRQGFFDLLQAQDAATASGADNVALLLRLQQVADDYYTRLEDYQAEALRAQEEMIQSQRGLVVDSLRDAEDAARSVRDAIGGLSVESEAFSQARRESALASLRQMANSGVVRPGDALNSALGTASNINANQFGSFEAYIREVASTGGLLSDLDAITQEQVSVEQRMLDSLDRQLEALEQGNAEQLQALVDLQTSVDQNTAATQAVPAAAAAVASSSSSSASSASNQALLTEVRQLRSEIQGSQRSIAKHTQRTARILERLEIDGIEVRE